MTAPEHTRLSHQLPPVYREDADSFRQVDAYLGLVDDLLLEAIGALTDAARGPDRALHWPARLPVDAGAQALLDAQLAALDEAADWVSFSFPSSWGRDEAGLARRRTFLARSARLWRRRGTPGGLVAWFCLYFGLDAPGERPFLLEHFTVPNGPAEALPFTATLFVPAAPVFTDHSRRTEAGAFVRWYSPAHVHVRVCYVHPDLLSTLAPSTDPPVLPPAPSEEQLARYLEQVVGRSRLLSELLCSVVSVVGHDGALHLTAPGSEERPDDQLDVGLLPHSGDG